MIQLDTSFLIRALVPGTAEDRALRKWLAGTETLGISAIAWTEFQCGPVPATAIEAARILLGEPISFTAEEAFVGARLFNDSGRRRGTLMDCMIAASAVTAGDVLATSNPADFKPFEKLGLVLSR